MNILILAGGTGSIALQTGLYELLDVNRDGFDTKVLVNAYDNGKSTGDVRKVMDGRILGPSDVRKNQTTRLKLQNPSSPWNKFLDVRFTSETNKAKEFCLSKLKELMEELRRDSQVSSSYCEILEVESAINSFFETPTASKIDYSDFSLANIVYAGLAKKNNNSLRAAARTMASLMDIKDNVILNDDTSLFLGAISKSGIRVTDEGDIVSWGKIDDPFVDVFFVNADGVEKKPVLCDEAKHAILKADLIILSSGTQWSSLIPTYASEGFKEAIENTAAKIVMVMNRQPDKDSPGQTASDIINLLVPKYFKPGTINVVIDAGGHPQMASLDNYAKSLVASCYVSTFPFITQNATTHDSKYLAAAVFKSYFIDYLSSDHFMFDYDDTLVGRGNYQSISSSLNKKLISYLNTRTGVSICTGNGIKAVALQSDSLFYLNPENNTKLAVYADGGVNLYSYNVIKSQNSDDAYKPDFVTCINQDCRLETKLIDELINVLLAQGIPYSSIENRGNVMISIKPINPDYRTITLNLLNILFCETGLIVRAAGRTTIEICKPHLTKQDAVKHILENGVKSITYIGDELVAGNDSVVPKMNDSRVKCLNVKDPAETSIFLSTLLATQNGF